MAILKNTTVNGDLTVTDKIMTKNLCINGANINFYESTQLTTDNIYTEVTNITEFDPDIDYYTLSSDR